MKDKNARILDRHGNIIAPLSMSIHRTTSRHLGDHYEMQIISIHKVSLLSESSVKTGISRAYKTERFKNGA